MSTEVSSRPQEPAAGLLVTADARPLCRAVGATAWAVLHDVALDARPAPQGRLVAATNVRRIAAHLGIGHDTAARALARLAGAGLVVRRDRRRGRSGQFVPSLYELRLAPGAGVELVAPTCPCSEPPCPVAKDTVAGPADRSAGPDAGRVEGAPARPRRPGRTSRPGQRVLFDVAGEASEPR